MFQATTRRRVDVLLFQAVTSEHISRLPGSRQQLADELAFSFSKPSLVFVATLMMSGAATCGPFTPVVGKLEVFIGIKHFWVVNFERGVDLAGQRIEVVLRDAWGCSVCREIASLRRNTRSWRVRARGVDRERLAFSDLPCPKPTLRRHGGHRSVRARAASSCQPLAPEAPSLARRGWEILQEQQGIQSDHGALLVGSNMRDPRSGRRCRV